MGNIHCAICQGEWDEDTGAIVGHPTEFHVCAECFDGGIVPLLNRHQAAPPRPTSDPCLVRWADGYGVPFPMTETEANHG